MLPFSALWCAERARKILERPMASYSSASTSEDAMTDRAEIVRRLKEQLEHHLNTHLCEMKPDYDDSITGFNEAWDIMRKLFDEIARREP